MYVYIYVYIYIYMCVYVYIYIYIFIYFFLRALLCYKETYTFYINPVSSPESAGGVHCGVTVVCGLLCCCGLWSPLVINLTQAHPYN